MMSHNARGIGNTVLDESLKELRLAESVWHGFRKLRQRLALQRLHEGVQSILGVNELRGSRYAQFISTDQGDAIFLRRTYPALPVPQQGARTPVDEVVKVDHVPTFPTRVPSRAQRGFGQLRMGSKSSAYVHKSVCDMFGFHDRSFPSPRVPRGGGHPLVPEGFRGVIFSAALVLINFVFSSFSEFPPALDSRGAIVKKRGTGERQLSAGRRLFSPDSGG